ncbi:MAG: hypothetical protein QOH57_833 [Mycobacterium sp.]|nr:hypothetical protein [Mycobacterium sp.]
MGRQVSARVHHSAIWAADIEVSTRFYVDGVGLEMLTADTFDGEWKTLFGAPGDRLHAVLLGDSDHPEAGVVELVTFEGTAAYHDPGPRAPGRGFLWLSFYVDVDKTLGRLAALGFKEFERIVHPSPAGPLTMATIRDPDGVMLELVDARLGQQVTG